MFIALVVGHLVVGTGGGLGFGLVALWLCSVCQLGLYDLGGSGFPLVPQEWDLRGSEGVRRGLWPV